MSDTIDDFRALKDMRARERQVFGIPCRVCIERLPKAQPKILQPQQLCRAHKPYHRDPRPYPTPAEWEAAMNETQEQS
jgi:hypothetical protein